MIGEMMGDMIEGEDVVSVHTWVEYLEDAKRSD